MKRYIPLLLLPLLALLMHSCSAVDSKYDPGTPDIKGDSYIGYWEEELVYDLNQSTVDLTSYQLLLNSVGEWRRYTNNVSQESGTYYAGEDEQGTYFVFCTPTDTLTQYYIYNKKADRLKFVCPEGIDGELAEWKRIF